MAKNKNPAIFDFKNKERAVRLYMKTMFNRTQAMFEYENLPDTVPARELERLLQEGGFAVWTKVNGELYAFTGGLDGTAENVYYDKSWATIANAPLNWSGTVYFKGNLKHEQDAVLMRNDSNLMGLWDINSKYATLLTETDLTMYLVDIMSRATAILTANDDKTFISAQKYLEDIQKGNLGIIAGNLMYESVNTQPYISEASGSITNLIELEQYSRAQWLNLMGINANYNMKREALNSSESALNEEALKPLVDDMLNCRQVALEEINSLWDLNISVKLSSSWETNKEKEDLTLLMMEAEAEPETEEQLPEASEDAEETSADEAEGTAVEGEPVEETTEEPITEEPEQAEAEININININTDEPQEEVDDQEEDDDNDDV